MINKIDSQLQLHIVYQLFKMRHNEMIVENRAHQELVALRGRYYRSAQTKLKWTTTRDLHMQADCFLIQIY